MSVINIIIPLFFIAITLKQISYMKSLIIPTRKSYVEIITVFFSVIILMWIIYFYADIWIHYVTGVLGILMFISMWIKQGITAEGFISMYKYKEIISWDEIEKIMVIISKDIKVKLTGRFIEQTFHFKISEYNKIITIIKERLPIQAKLELIDNPKS